MERHSVLLLERGGEIGGAERVLLDVVCNVDRNRFRPVAVCLGEGTLPMELRSLGVPTSVFPVGRLREAHRVARALIGLVRVIRSEEIDLVHVNGTMMLLYGGPVAWITRRPLVWHVYDPQRRVGRSRRWFVAFVSQFKPAWTIFGTVEVEANHMKVFSNIGRCSTILPGVVVEPGLVEPDRSVLPAAIPEDAVVLLSLARHVPGKGLDDLIAALSELRSSDPAVHLVLCGGLPAPGYTDELQRLADRVGVRSRTHFVGHVPEATKLAMLATCDIVVHPATSEPFGLAVLEAMAAGKPVVAADAAGPSVTVQHGLTGVLYRRGDVGQLVAALDRLVADVDLRRGMGDAGRARAAEFSVVRLSGGVEKVWGDVLALRGADFGPS